MAHLPGDRKSQDEYLCSVLGRQPRKELDKYTYYYANGESFQGLFAPPEYQERFETLVREAVGYYDS